MNTRINDALSTLSADEEEAKPLGGMDLVKKLLGGVAIAGVAGKLGGTAGVNAVGGFFANRAAQDKQRKLDRVNRAKRVIEGEQARMGLERDDQAIQESKARLGNIEWEKGQKVEEVKRQISRDKEESARKTMEGARATLRDASNADYKEGQLENATLRNEIARIRAEKVKDGSGSGIPGSLKNLSPSSTVQQAEPAEGGPSPAEKEKRSAAADLAGVLLDHYKKNTGQDFRALPPRVKRQEIAKFVSENDITSKLTGNDRKYVVNELNQALMTEQERAGYDRFKDPATRTLATPMQQYIDQEAANLGTGLAAPFFMEKGEGVPVQDFTKEAKPFYSPRLGSRKTMRTLQE